MAGKWKAKKLHTTLHGKYWQRQFTTSDPEARQRGKGSPFLFQHTMRFFFFALTCTSLWSGKTTFRHAGTNLGACCEGKKLQRISWEFYISWDKKGRRWTCLVKELSPRRNVKQTWSVESAPIFLLWSGDQLENSSQILCSFTNDVQVLFFQDLALARYFGWTGAGKTSFWH